MRAIRSKTAKIFGSIIFVLFVICVPLLTYTQYFVFAANDPANYYSFRSDLTVVSNYLNGSGSPENGTPANKLPRDYVNPHTKQNTYLVLDKFSVQTTDYLTSFDAANPSDPRNQPYTQVDPEDSWKLSGLKSGDQIVFAQSSIFDVTKFKQYHPEAHKKLEVRNKFLQAVLAVYEIK